MTRAAYRAAIDWAASTGAPLGLECDVHFSADDQLVCLHDEDLRRTAGRTERAVDLTVAQLKRLDFGSWLRAVPTAEECELVTLAELLAMTAAARGAGVDVTLAIETKHPNPRELDVEDRLADMLCDAGWDVVGSPVRLITFDLDALARLGRLLPALPRTLLVQRELAPWTDGELPAGVDAFGVDLKLLRLDPGFVERARRLGNDVHVYTVNHAEDVRFCRDLGVTGFTTDDPPRVRAVLAEDADDLADDLAVAS